MPIQNSDPAKIYMVSEQMRYQNEMLSRDGPPTTTDLTTQSRGTIDMAYVDRLLGGDLTRDEFGIVYNSVFLTKTDKHGNTYLDDVDKSFDYVAMADYIVKTLDVMVFASREKPAMPKRVVMDVGGRYVPASAEIPWVVNYLSSMIVKEGNVNNVVYAITNNVRVRTYFEDMQTNTRRANFLNGVVDISGDEVVLTARGNDDMFFTRVPHNYPVDGVECPVFQEFLDYALDQKYHKFIYEWIGYCFFETYEFQHIVFHHGIGGSGKSTLLKLVAAVLGPSNVTGVSLKQAAHEKFSLNHLDGALANHGSEVSYKDLKDGGEVLKQLSSGVDPVLVEQKYEKAYPIINTAKLTYAMNNLPKVYQEDSGLWRRLILVEWLKPIKPADGRRFNSADVGMLTPDEVSGVIYKSIQAFHAMTKRGEFSYAPEPRDVEGDYATKSDSMGVFVHDCIEFSDVHTAGYRDGEGDWEATADIYNAYIAWCVYKGAKPMEPGTFTSKNGLAEELSRTSAIRERRKHGGKYNVRGWKHVRLVADTEFIQTNV